MFGFLKKIFSKINRLDDYVSTYKDNAGEISMPGYAYMHWGMKLLSEGENEQGVKMLEKSIQMPYANADSYVQLGMVYAKQGKFDKALDFFKKATKLDNENAKAYQMLGSVYSEFGKFEEAKNAFAISLKINPKDPQTYANRAIFYAKAGKFKEAHLDFKSCCSLNPTSANGWYLWGVLCSQCKDYDGAVERLKKAANLQPFHADAYFHLASISFLQKKFKDTIKYAKKSIAIDNKRVETYVALAEAWLQLNNEKECFLTYENAEKHCKPDSRFYYSKGAAFQYFKKWEESVKPLYQALDLDKNNFLACAALSIVHSMRGEEEISGRMLECAIEINPEYVLGYYNLGRHYLKVNDMKNAIECFKKTIAINPNMIHVYPLLAECYEVENDHKTALEYWLKSIEYAPSDINLKFSLIKSYVKNNDVKSAMRKARSVYRENKNNKKVILMYAKLLMEDSEYHDAIEKFDEVLKIDSKSRSAKFEKALCLINIGKIDEVQKILDTYNEDNPDGLYLMASLNCRLIYNENRRDLIEPAMEICDKIMAAKNIGQFLSVKTEEMKTALIAKKEEV